MTNEAFLEFVKGECIKHNVKFRIGGELVNIEGERANGYFTTEPNPQLVISSDVSLDHLVHEYVHMLQFVELGEKWFHKIPIAELELDCEKRSVEIIKKFKLKLGINKYIKLANAYLYSFTIKDMFPDKKMKLYPSMITSIIDKCQLSFLLRKNIKHHQNGW